MLGYSANNQSMYSIMCAYIWKGIVIKSVTSAVFSHMVDPCILVNETEAFGTIYKIRSDVSGLSKWQVLFIA